MITQSYFRGYLSGRQPILRFSHVVERPVKEIIAVESTSAALPAAEHSLPRSLFNKFSCEEPYRADVSPDDYAENS